nr:fatty acid-binding protein, intestinal isoform X1 [Anser cygnoides]
MQKHCQISSQLPDRHQFICIILTARLLHGSPPTDRKMAFNGAWKIDRNENYEKFMETMGVNIMKRKLGAHDNLKITIQQDGNKFLVKESSNFRTIDIEFTLGVSFEYSLADGTELTGSWNMEGNKLVGTFTRKDNGKALTAYREIVGDELVQTYVYEGVEAKRFFKKC